MKEIREYEEPDNIEIRVLSPEEISEILERHRLLTDEEISEILRECNREFPTAAAERRLMGHSEIDEHEKKEFRRGRKLEYKIHIELPKYENKKIESVSQLVGIVFHERPDLLKRRDYPKLLDHASKYLAIITDDCNQEHIDSPEISRLSKEMQLSKTTIRDWVTKGAIPRLIYLLDTSVFYKKSEAKQLRPSHRTREFPSLFSELSNGIGSVQELNRRLETLYIRDEIKISPKMIMHAGECFSIVKAIANGADSIDRISRETKIEYDAVRRRIYSGRPSRFIKLIAYIPKEPPDEGFAWLPLQLSGTRMKDFIQVPQQEITPPKLRLVLSQLRNRCSERIVRQKRIDGMDFVDSFFYFLGLSISDGNFSGSKKSVMVSDRMRLSLAQKYRWSSIVGEAYCDALYNLGFKSKRLKDKISPLTGEPLYVWGSESSPFFLWIRKELLGLRESRNKSSVAISADWAYTIPRQWRISLLQGIADGDGYATTKGLCAAISTYTNQEFVTKLLKSLDIRSISTGTAVGIRSIDGIAKAAKLPMFKFAEGRQRHLEKLIPMLGSMDRSRISEEEEFFILELNKQGLSVGTIIEELWRKYGRVRRRNTIYSIIERSSTRREIKEK